MSRVLLDTSTFIAGINGEFCLSSLPGAATISVMTICELYHGVLVASDANRPDRLRALDVAQHDFDAFPVDYRVALGSVSSWRERAKRRKHDRTSQTP